MENFEDSKSENPWQVDSVQAFLYLHCPECVFVTPLKEQGNFHDHAIENHPLSLLGVFGKSNIKEEHHSVPQFPTNCSDGKMPLRFSD